MAVTSVAAMESWCQSSGATYPVLADPEHRVAETYGVYNLLGDGHAAPAVFVIEPRGRIGWSHVGQNRSDQVSPSTILEHLP